MRKESKKVKCLAKSPAVSKKRNFGGKNTMPFTEVSPVTV